MITITGMTPQVRGASHGCDGATSMYSTTFGELRVTEPRVEALIEAILTFVPHRKFAKQYAIFYTYHRAVHEPDLAHMKALYHISNREQRVLSDEARQVIEATFALLFL